MVNTTPEFIAEYKCHVLDPRWRVAHLYRIKPHGAGSPIDYVPNPLQARLYRDLWNRNVILKGRGMGSTTGVLVEALDSCYRTDNFSCAIVAHTQDKATEIFQAHIRFMHYNCEYPIKRELAPDTYGSKSELRFVNGSRIAVYVTMAGGSHQSFIWTEAGVQSDLDPEGAKIVKMQGLPTARDDLSKVFIESTGQGGPRGVFYETCLAAREETAMILAGKIKRGPKSFRFHFFPWFEDPRKVRSDEYPITKEDAEYFKKIEHTLKITLANEQKWWYCETANGTEGLAKIGEMHSQYPSTFDEAFESFVQDAYLTDALARAADEGRIGTFKYDPMYPVDTWWDIGFDGTAIWFTQDIGNMIHVIWFYENVGPGLPFYLDYIQGGMVKLPWNKARYRFHVAPHDQTRRDFATMQNVWKVAKARGVEFEKEIERPARKQDTIQAAMMFVHRCRFDKENAANGLMRLENYRPQWDTKLDMAKPLPKHDKNSHAGDAYQVLAMWHDRLLARHGEQRETRTTPGAMPMDYPR